MKLCPIKKLVELELVRSCPQQPRHSHFTGLQMGESSRALGVKVRALCLEPPVWGMSEIVSLHPGSGVMGLSRCVLRSPCDGNSDIHLLSVGQLPNVTSAICHHMGLERPFQKTPKSLGSNQRAPWFTCEALQGLRVACCLRSSAGVEGPSKIQTTLFTLDGERTVKAIMELKNCSCLIVQLWLYH